METKNLTRETNFEALRILAMLFIVASHAAFDLTNPFTGTGFLGFFSALFLAGGKAGAALFFILNGYFLFHGGPVNTNRLLSLEIKSIIVSYFFLFMALITGSYLLKEVPVVAPVAGLSFLDPFLESHLFASFFGASSSFFIKEALPSLSFDYWFISDYMILEICRPFLYKVFSDKKKMKIGLFFLGFITIILPTFLAGFGINLLLEPFLALFYYLLGGYFQTKKREESSIKSTLWLLGGIIGLLLAVFSLMGSLEFGSSYLRGLTSNISSFDSPLVTLMAVGLFFAAFYHKPFFVKWVNAVASLTIYVYLIHENVYMRSYLFQTVFFIPYWSKTPYLPLALLFALLVTFVLCIGIGYLIENKLPKLKPSLLSKFAVIRRSKEQVSF